MDSFKRLSSGISFAARHVAGGLMVLSAMAFAAHAGVPPGSNVPEMDPGSICAAITLLLGSSMLVTGRRLSK